MEFEILINKQRFLSACVFSPALLAERRSPDKSAVAPPDLQIMYVSAYQKIPLPFIIYPTHLIFPQRHLSGHN